MGGGSLDQEKEITPSQRGLVGLEQSQGGGYQKQQSWSPYAEGRGVGVLTGWRPAVPMRERRMGKGGISFTSCCLSQDPVHCLPAPTELSDR